MNRTPDRQAPDSSSQPKNTPPSPGGRSKLVPATLVLCLCFGWPLLQLANFALHRDLYSHILLIPLISGYLVWESRKAIPGRAAPDKAFALLFAILGAACLAVFLMIRLSGEDLALEDSLAIKTASFLLFFAALCFFFLGRPIVRKVAFPLGFLVFMIPIPVFVMDSMVSGLQTGSAFVADLMLELVGTPVVFQGLRLQLSDITLEVAPECSGIHSSLALLVTAVLAAFLFLRTPWKRAALIFAVVPLALLRNGFRVFTIGELCVHMGPDMINSYIHRHGGPIFFAISLVPFLALLLLFSRGDRRKAAAGGNSPGA
jgi:exosortase C (VPDSG-CTERM-specific)